MSSQPNNQDPIVQILIEAYKRGRSILENSQPAEQDTSPVNVKLPRRKGSFTRTATTDNCRGVPAKDNRNADTT